MRKEHPAIKSVSFTQTASPPDIVAKRLSLTDWTAAAQIAAGDNWNEMNTHYSFLAAYNKGMSPEQAVNDCRDWLES